MARTSKIMLNYSGESGHPCIVPDFRGNAFGFSPMRIMFALGLSYLYYVRYVASMSVSGEFFFLIINKCWILSKAFSASIEMIVWFLFFNLYHIDWFAYIGKSLHPWNKNHLIMMYDLFNVLLGSVCYNFVEDFCIYVHQWCWPIIFFLCGIFVCFFGIRVIVAS